MFDKSKEEKNFDLREAESQFKTPYQRVYESGENILVVCDRCLQTVNLPNKTEVKKEIFDVYYTVGFILCPVCRDELEKFKNNAYSLKTKVVFGVVDGEFTEEIEDAFPTMDAVENKIDEYERTVQSKALSMGYAIKDKTYVIKYIPYAERKK